MESIFSSKLLWLLLWISGLSLVACKKDMACRDELNPDCPNYNVCLAEGLPDASFKMFRKSNTVNGDTIIYMEMPILDSAYYGGQVYFRANSRNDTYAWQVGTDPREFTEREFWLQFSRRPGSDASLQIDVSLTVDRELTACPDRGQESNTSSKRVTFVPVSNFPILGRFIGNNQSERGDLDDFIIEFGRGPDFIHLRHFPRGAIGGEFINNITLYDDYKVFLFEPNLLSCCKRAHGIGYLSDDKRQLRIEYTTYDQETDTWKEDVWEGVRTDD